MHITESVLDPRKEGNMNSSEGGVDGCGERTFGVWDLTLPARAREPWTLPMTAVWFWGCCSSNLGCFCEVAVDGSLSFIAGLANEPMGRFKTHDRR